MTREKPKVVSGKEGKGTDDLLEMLKQSVQNGLPQKDDPKIQKTKEEIAKRIAAQEEKERQERAEFNRRQSEEYERHQTEFEELRRKDRERASTSLGENGNEGSFISDIPEPKRPTMSEKLISGLKSAGSRVGKLSLFLIPASCVYGAYRLKAAADADYSTYSSEGTFNLPIDGSKTIDGGSCSVTNTGAGVNGIWGFLVKQLNANGTPITNWHNIAVGSLFTDSNACQDSIKVHFISIAPNGTATVQVFANNAVGGASLWGGVLALCAVAIVSTVVIIATLLDR